LAEKYSGDYFLLVMKGSFSTNQLLVLLARSSFANSGDKN